MSHKGELAFLNEIRVDIEPHTSHIGDPDAIKLAFRNSGDRSPRLAEERVYVKYEPEPWEEELLERYDRAKMLGWE